MILGNAQRRSVNRHSCPTDSSYAAVPNASDTKRRYLLQDHQSENRLRHLNRRREERTRMDTEIGRELITVQAADRLAVSRWMVYQLIWAQQVKSVQIGRCRRIVRQSLDDYLSGLIEGAA
jgi:excisionase family DNA binding protein